MRHFPLTKTDYGREEGRKGGKDQAAKDEGRERERERESVELWQERMAFSGAVTQRCGCAAVAKEARTPARERCPHRAMGHRTCEVGCGPAFFAAGVPAPSSSRWSWRFATLTDGGHFTCWNLLSFLPHPIVSTFHAYFIKFNFLRIFCGLR